MGSLLNSIEVLSSKFKKKKSSMTPMFPPHPCTIVPDAVSIKLFLVFGFRGTPAETQTVSAVNRKHLKLGCIGFARFSERRCLACYPGLEV